MFLELNLYNKRQTASFPGFVNQKSSGVRQEEKTKTEQQMGNLRKKNEAMAKEISQAEEKLLKYSQEMTQKLNDLVSQNSLLETQLKESRLKM